MKNILFLLTLVLFFGCNKSSVTQVACTDVVVSLSAPSCKHVGVIINGTLYPSDDLPDQYAINGKHICIEYSLWDDPKLCACCGGTKVHVIAVH